MEPSLASDLVVDGRVEEAGGDAAAGRAAGLHRLELLARGDAAADVEDDRGQRSAHGHFHQAAVGDLAGEGEDGRALALLGADAGEPVGAPVDDDGDGGQGLDVVDDGGFAVQPGLRREGRAGAGHAAPALDGGHQRRLLAADESAGAFLDMHAEVEAGAEDVLAQEALLLCLLPGRCGGA